MPVADRRLVISGVLAAAVFTTGAAIHWFQNGPVATEPAAKISRGGWPGSSPLQESRLHAAFQQAVAMLHTKRFDEAVAAWEEVLELMPAMPEAHVNLGFSLIGIDDWARARDSFERALELRSGQRNAYYGLALCHEHAGDLDLALGAMRVFVHLEGPESPHARRALAAIWEWDAARNRPRTPESEVGAIEASAADG
jgi:tetratricopeptide (TPR) repeat protein